MDALEEATTEELVLELKRRHTGLLVATVQDAEEGDRYDLVRVHFFGGLVLARGLVAEAADHLARVARPDADGEDDDDV